MLDKKYIKDLFLLDKNLIHFNNLLITSYPEPVRKSILKWEEKFNKNPGKCWIENVTEQYELIAQVAAKYMQVDSEGIAFTTSATMGLGITFAGLNLPEGPEIIISEQDHYSAHMACKYIAEKNNYSIKKVSWYENASLVSEEDFEQKIGNWITDSTRVLFATWVHSCTGVKLPIEKISRALKKINDTRSDDQKILFIVDGVHGFGIEQETVKELNVDVFITSCHKWLFGPRGTGLVWFRDSARKYFRPTIPCYDFTYYDSWRTNSEMTASSFGKMMSPGGFHNFESHWSLVEAFKLHQEISPKYIDEESTKISQYLKDKLKRFSNIKLITPLERSLSSALVCFEVENKNAHEVLTQLEENNILASVTPYFNEYARFSPGVFNTINEADIVLDCVKKM